MKSDFYNWKYIRYIVSAFSFLLFFSSCTKTETDDIDLDYQNVKVYDDTLASAENVNVHVNAGKDRLYMSYGRGSTVYSIWNFGFFQTADEISGVVMATDLKGNVIWRRSLPVGLANVSPVELADGSCLIAGTNMYAYNLTVPTDKIYLFHFDRDGNTLMTDSIVLPVNDFYANGAIMHLNLLPLSGNDVLIYGTSSSSTWTRWRSFTIKYNPVGGVQWVKPVDFIPPGDTTNNTAIYNCIKTMDGGLIFIGSFDGPAEPGDSLSSKNVVIKTTIDCDIVWKKWYDYMKTNSAWNQVSPTNIIQVSDGSYYFCTNDVPGLYTTGSVLGFEGYIYHLDQAGDSIGGITISGKRNSYCSGIVEDLNRNIVGIFNKYPDYIFINFETYYRPFNTELMIFDRNLKQIGQDDIQTQRTDFVTSCCRMPDGKMAYFGLTSSYNHQYYRPVLIIKD